MLDFGGTLVEHWWNIGMLDVRFDGEIGLDRYHEDDSDGLEMCLQS